MAANELTLPTVSNGPLISNKALGIIGMLFAPCLYLGWFFHAPVPNAPKEHPLMASLFGVLYLTGALASAVALRGMRVTGSGKGAAILFAIQVIGLVLAMGFDVLEYAVPHMRATSIIFIITDIAYPFSHVLMIIIGVAIWRAKVWTGWRLLPAFLVGFALPSFFTAMALIGQERGGWFFVGGVTIGWFLLGLSVLTWRPSLR
jgi:hypothetical protein